MNKISNYILLFFLIFLLNCAYEPILKEQNYQFSINVSNEEGNKQINSIIINKFNYLKENKKIYDLSLNSNMRKNIISKDSKGDPSIFELIINVEFTVENNKENLIRRSIFRKTTYNNISDKFELSNYEKTIIKNLSDAISNNILSSISDINK
tara:strand:- start:1495 stop:1953 length:459 start_codon:yes stop_codon:yes gene_type:complete